MEAVDPATGQALPSDAIQRVLFIANAVHVYNIPPLTSTKGYTAATWTTDPQRHIFTARLRLVETASDAPPGDGDGPEPEQEQEQPQSLKVDVVLEDPASGQLFAAAPYTAPAVVEPVLDSSRFFALTVRDPQGRRAVLGLGFEERSDAFDLSIALQEARRALGWEGDPLPLQPPAGRGVDDDGKKRDYSLKEGETITVSFGGASKLGRRRPQADEEPSSSSGDLQAFALPPPPPGPGGGGFPLPPPPSAQDVKRKRLSAKDLGFDDGQFGEFA